jgi:hypothetical protein
MPGRDGICAQEQLLQSQSLPMELLQSAFFETFPAGAPVTKVGLVVVGPHLLGVREGHQDFQLLLAHVSQLCLCFSQLEAREAVPRMKL